MCVDPCTNGRQDGAETGVDCGGGCLACNNAPCNRPQDCESSFCSSCTDLNNCQVCSSACVNATCGTPPQVIYNTTCFAVLLLRNGAVVESQSSEGLCENMQRQVRPQPRDVTFLYVNNPTVYNPALVHATSPDFAPQNRRGRCVPAFARRVELLEEVERSATATWTTIQQPPPFLSMFCEAAALYTW